MRPRVFPAEDGGGRRRAGADASPASMRPRVFPAEDRVDAHDRHRDAGASMRPRVFPAEDGQWLRRAGRDGLASMRPRVFPAEDIVSDSLWFSTRMLQ